MQILLANGLDRIFVRPFNENDHDRSLHKSMPLPMEATLAASIRQAHFIGDNAFGVVPYGREFGICVKSKHFEEILLHVHPE